MKKISVIISGIVCLGLSELSATPTSVVRKYNGGIFGYKNVYQEGNYLLECSEPGYTRCRWTTPPAGGSTYDYEQIEVSVNEALDKGEREGKGNINGLYYEWIGSDQYNVEIRFGFDGSEF